MPRPSCKFLYSSHNPVHCGRSVAMHCMQELLQDFDIAMRTVLFCALAPCALHSLLCTKHLHPAWKPYDTRPPNKTGRAAAREATLTSCTSQHVTDTTFLTAPPPLEPRPAILRITTSHALLKHELVEGNSVHVCNPMCIRADCLCKGLPCAEGRAQCRTTPEPTWLPAK